MKHVSEPTEYDVWLNERTSGQLSTQSGLCLEGNVDREWNDAL